jgi:hypothetical protein
MEGNIDVIRSNRTKLKPYPCVEGMLLAAPVFFILHVGLFLKKYYWTNPFGG